jgi:hypothetical protein
MIPTFRYLKNVDRFQEWNVSAWVTPGGKLSNSSFHAILFSDSCVRNVGMRLILLHESKNDDGIRLFLHETWECYVKVREYLHTHTERERERSISWLN